ncbi:MAG TPA: hypothetical protein EYP90_12790, partial [Chromatiaceae bacterium]|nr:hypothetical protein [Chromatiaceae bacterium]
MTEAKVAGDKPQLVAVERGSYYYWCACGRSQRQPFCDGSHFDTPLKPLVWQAPQDDKVLFCTCKQTRTPPLCDGSHNRLSEHYGVGTAAPEAQTVDRKRMDDEREMAVLDGGCYVIRSSAIITATTTRLQPLINHKFGATHLDQYVGVVPETSPCWQVSGAEAAMFVLDGEGEIEIDGQSQRITAHSAVLLRAGERFRLRAPAAEPLRFNLTVCPGGATVAEVGDMTTMEAVAAPHRVEHADPAQREAMADRYFQVLIDDQRQGSQITVFIGYIPQSRAAHHRHLYEETLTVL